MQKCTVCGSVEIYENYFEMKKRKKNKRKENEFSAAAKKTAQISAAAISRGLVYEPRQKLLTLFLLAFYPGLYVKPGQMVWPYIYGSPSSPSATLSCFFSWWEVV